MFIGTPCSKVISMFIGTPCSKVIPMFIGTPCSKVKLSLLVLRDL